MLTQEQDVQPEHRGETDSKKVMSRQVKMDVCIHTSRPSVCVCLCVCVRVQTVGGAGIEDSELRGMRHCIKSEHLFLIETTKLVPRKQRG